MRYQAEPCTQYENKRGVLQIRMLFYMDLENTPRIERCESRDVLTPKKVRK